MSVVMMFGQAIRRRGRASRSRRHRAQSSVRRGDSIARSTEIEPPPHCVICSGCR